MHLVNFPSANKLQSSVLLIHPCELSQMSCFSSWFGFITDLHMRAHKLFASAIRSAALGEQHKG